MKLYPGMTVNLWLRNLAPVFSGDTLDLNDVEVTFAIANSNDEIVVESGPAVPVGSAFRRIVNLPSSPGIYEVLSRAVSGTSLYRSVTEIRVLPAANDSA